MKINGGEMTFQNRKKAFLLPAEHIVLVALVGVLLPELQDPKARCVSLDLLTEAEAWELKSFWEWSREASLDELQDVLREIRMAYKVGVLGLDPNSEDF